MGRAPCCDKNNVKRGPWSPEEDAILRSYVETNGTGGNWIALPKKAGLRRCGKSCRLRWLNYLRPDIKHGGFTEEEDEIIYNMYNEIGSRWSVIASQLRGRTDNDVKNYWNTKLKKKLLSSGKLMMNPTLSNYASNYPTNNTSIPGLGSTHKLPNEPQQLAVNPSHQLQNAGYENYQEFPQVHYVNHQDSTYNNNSVGYYSHMGYDIKPEICSVSSSQEYSISSISNSPSIGLDSTSNVSLGGSIEEGGTFADHGMGQMWDFVNELLFADEAPGEIPQEYYQPSLPGINSQMILNQRLNL